MDPFLDIIPFPKHLDIGECGQPEYRWDGLVSLVLPPGHTPSLLEAALVLADELERFTGRRLRFDIGGSRGGVSLLLRLEGVGNPESYKIVGGAEGLVVTSPDERGLFYGLQTIRQMVNASDGVSYRAFELEDAPDFEARGFYHDVTRSAVPKLETLFQLVDKLAYYKLNQLQLYVEHTFAFAKHTDIWQGCDPLTAEEILRLQEYCISRHVELVPSISTFGHCYMLLRSKRLEKLNELDINASERPYSFHDRMAHYTLNPSDPGSIDIVRSILEEYLPLFKSSLCNICCDETFDLGKGKNKEIAKDEMDVKKLYVGFLKKIIGIVGELGKTAMFWADIIGEHPELVADLPEGVIPLEWDYRPNADRRDTEKLAKCGRKFYICPGTWVWNHWLADIDTASKNILNYAKKGLKHGACGLLNTNWGDFGNINLPATSWHGLAFGAGCAWNTKHMADVGLDVATAIDRQEFKSPGGRPGIVACWEAISRTCKVTWTAISQWVDPTDEVLWEDWSKEIPFEEVKDAIPRLDEEICALKDALAAARPLDPFACEEIRFGAEMTILMHKIAASMHFPELYAREELADEVRMRERQLCKLWHRRNKPSEYYRIRETLLRVANKLDAMAQAH